MIDLLVIGIDVLLSTVTGEANALNRPMSCIVGDAADHKMEIPHSEERSYANNNNIRICV